MAGPVTVLQRGKYVVSWDCVPSGSDRLQTHVAVAFALPQKYIPVPMPTTGLPNLWPPKVSCIFSLAQTLAPCHHL